MTLASILLLAAVGSVAIAAASPYQDSDQVEDSDDLLERLQAVAKRDHECAVIGGKCFNTGHCCSGLLCAVLDEEIGDKPEVPGYCVKSKDLQTCNIGGSDSVVGAGGCPSGERCVALGRMGQRYCLPIPRENGSISEFRSIKMTDRRRYHNQASSKGIGKLGSSCVSDADCAPRSEDGLNRMCCQMVNRGRQGSKRICDRVTQISTCTGA